MKTTLFTLLCIFCSMSYTLAQQEGCTDPNACNYDNFAEVDDGSCEFASCFLYEVISNEAIGVCDTTYLTFTLALYTYPYIEIWSEQAGGFIQNLYSGEEFSYVCVPHDSNNANLVNDDWFFDFRLPLSGYDPPPFVGFTSTIVYTSHPTFMPELTQIDNTVMCTNIDWDLTWYLDDQNDGQDVEVIESASPINLPPNFNGSVQACTVRNLDYDLAPYFVDMHCEMCSEWLGAVGINHLETIPSFSIVGNGGEHPQLVAHKSDTFRVFDSTGKLIVSEYLYAQETLEFNLPAGMYYVVGSESSVKIVVSP